MTANMNAMNVSQSIFRDTPQKGARFARIVEEEREATEQPEEALPVPSRCQSLFNEPQTDLTHRDRHVLASDIMVAKPCSRSSV